MSSMKLIQRDVEVMQVSFPTLTFWLFWACIMLSLIVKNFFFLFGKDFKTNLQSLGVFVESIHGGEPIDGEFF